MDASHVGRDSHGTRTSTTQSAISKHLDVEELEMLLEAYFVQIDGTLNKLSTVCKIIYVFYHVCDQLYFKDDAASLNLKDFFGWLFCREVINLKYVFSSNGQSPLLAKSTVSRYFSFWVFPFRLPLKVFKTRLLGRGFHIFIKSVSFSSSTDVGSHNPPPFRAHHPR